MRAGRPSITAGWIAAHRAKLAGSRPSTPTGDPDAERRLYQGMSRLHTLPGLAPVGLVERTQFIDNEVARAIGDSVEQIVILGAGYDGRTLRFGGGPTRWIEVDFPATQAEKQARLAALSIDPGPSVTYAGVDLLHDDLDAALAGAGHQAGDPSLFICEGLLAYLPLEVCAALCETLRGRAAPGSTLTLNVRVVAPAGKVAELGRGLTDLLFSRLGEARRVTFEPGDIEKLLTVTGWRLVRSKSSGGHRLDGGSASGIVLAAEPI
jgi:methyltransferase (TIGR00027 family)